MPKVVLASGLARWMPNSASAHPGEITVDVDGETLGEVLEHMFAQHPTLRGYVVDERGAVRHHVAIFVDGTAIRDKVALQVPVPVRSEVYILQALSGG